MEYAAKKGDSPVY